MITAVDSLINKFEEDQLRKEAKQQSVSQYTDNCSDSDSSFNQVRVSLYTHGRVVEHDYYYYFFFTFY